jgi:hypothetical protein
MKRIALVFALAAVAAGGVYYASHRAHTTPHANVTTLLPAGTVAFAHLPDFQRTRADWKESDLFKLYHEPAVQDFLKPVKNVSQQDATTQNLSDLERLDPKDAFVAVTSLENNSPHFVAGFRLTGKQSDAEQIIDKWRARLVRDSSIHETVEYEQHKIDIAGAAPNQIATVYDKQLFLASNDLAELKTILDRADGRTKDQQNTLEVNETFRAAMAHMPPSYALLFYGVPTKLSASLKNQVSTNAGDNARAALEQFQSICGAGRFEKGKIRDVFFLGAPKSPPSPELTRNSLKLGTADTFLYIAALLNPDRLAFDQGSGGLPLGSWWQKLFDVASRSGLTADDWKAAFNLEASALADWPQTAHLPSIVTLLPVKDPARALKIAELLPKAFDEDATWRKTEKDGVRYYYMQSPVALFAITPTIAISNEQMIIGLDSVSVEAAMTRSQSGARSTTALSDSSTYKTASRSVPAPTTAFVYIDTALLYSRLDAALRPMLLMSAAFMPAIGEYVDVTKVPPTEVVTRHLTPIVLSQRYERDGYVTESTGPISLEAGLALPALGWALNLEKNRP